MSAAGLAEAARRMHERGLDERAIAVFSDYYHQLELGAQGTIPEDSIEPLVDLTRLDGVGATEAERAQALGQVVVIKLNGGLGTHVGLAGGAGRRCPRDGGAVHSPPSPTGVRQPAKSSGWVATAHSAASTPAFASSAKKASTRGRRGR